MMMWVNSLENELKEFSQIENSFVFEQPNCEQFSKHSHEAIFSMCASLFTAAFVRVWKIDNLILLSQEYKIRSY